MPTVTFPKLHPDLKHIANRSSRPVVFPNIPKKLTTPILAADGATPLPNPKNIQGDIYLRFPKIYQGFIFFIVSDVLGFKKALKSYKPTTAFDVTETLRAISNTKADASSDPVDIPMTQIAFTRLGMTALGESEATGDPRFDKGSMRKDKDVLGDKSTWDPPFEDANTHGVIMVCAKGQPTYTKAKSDIRKLFESSIKVLQATDIVEGNVRPKPFKGKEHFGYQDSLSEPALRHLMHVYPGQLQVDPGVIILGYKGDPVFDDPNATPRPAWTKDGSMMVFRKLEQDVLGFRQYLTDNGPNWKDFTPVPDEVKPPLTDAEGAEFFGAHIVGRWKSGTPLAMAHFRDDSTIGANPEKTNDFDYVTDLPKSVKGPSDRYCPFTAHTRKTAPRNLLPYVDPKYLESSIIVRAGIPYGSEVTDTTKDDPRGLLFVCYQSSLDNGFYRQTTGFAGNDYFPITGLSPQKHGQDPILGGPEPTSNVDGTGNVDSEGQINLRISQSNTSTVYEVTGWAKKVNTSVKPPFEPQYFVTSRGGEYYFVPSVSTLQTWATDGKTGNALDIMFLQDATGSQQPYVNATKGAIQTIINELVKSGTWSSGDIRVGVTAFRDHPPQDDTFVTDKFDFTSDISSAMKYLGNLKAMGGGDGPEAQSDALTAALYANWKDGATRVAVLITDSPPHGIKEDDDLIPDGCPDQNDPVHIAKQMLKHKITLYVIACEPTLSEMFSTAHDFYAGIAQKTGGYLVGLGDSAAIGKLIIGSSSDAAAMEKHVKAQQEYISRQAKKNVTFDDISEDLYKKFTADGIKLDTHVFDNIYNDAKLDALANQKVWFEADQLDSDTLAKIKDVDGYRVKDAYRSKPPSTQASSVKKQSITLDQVKTIVMKGLARAVD